MFTFSNIILILTATLAALIAGLFYGWSVSVILGLKGLTDKEHVAFMQSTNRAILNPIFFMSFFGTAILLPISTFLNYGQILRFWLLLVATLTYLIGVFGVTIFGNVPMNNKLESFDMKKASEEEIANTRNNYEGRWGNLNHLRAICATLAIIIVIMACLA